MPEIFEPELIDAKYLVSNRDAIAALRDLVFKEGIFAGPSCGAVLVAEHQSAGRGRNGRSWSAPPRSQIALSIGVGAEDVPADLRTIVQGDRAKTVGLNLIGLKRRGFSFQYI